MSVEMVTWLNGVMFFAALFGLIVVRWRREAIIRAKLYYTHVLIQLMLIITFCVSAASIIYAFVAYHRQNL